MGGDKSAGVGGADGGFDGGGVAAAAAGGFDPWRWGDGGLIRDDVRDVTEACGCGPRRGFCARGRGRVAGGVVGGGGMSSRDVWRAGSAAAGIAEREAAAGAAGERQPCNADVYLNHGPGDDTVPVRCPHDRAHSIKDSMDNLVPAKRLLGRETKPRRYSACNVNGAGLSIDSQADALYEMQRRLGRELGGVEGVTPGPAVASVMAAVLGKWEARLGEQGLRRLLRYSPDDE